jgi:hypothetical protein
VTDAMKAKIAAEGCLYCGGPVHVLPEGVLCQDCEMLTPPAHYSAVFAIEAGYENLLVRDTAAK